MHALMRHPKLQRNELLQIPALAAKRHTVVSGAIDNQADLIMAVGERTTPPGHNHISGNAAATRREHTRHGVLAAQGQPRPKQTNRELCSDVRRPKLHAQELIRFRPDHRLSHRVRLQSRRRSRQG